MGLVLLGVQQTQEGPLVLLSGDAAAQVLGPVGPR